MSGSDEYDEDYSEEGSEEEDYEIGRGARSRLDARQDPGSVQEYAHAYARLDEDVLGDDESDDDEDDFFLDPGMSGKNKGFRGESESSPSYMFFDFRRGRTKWPEGVELLDHKRATELLEKAKKDAEAELKRLAEREALKDKKQDKDNEAAAANQKKKSAMRQGGIPPGDFMLEGFVPAGGAVGWDAGGIQSWLGSHKQGTQVETEEEVVKDTTAPDDAVFETLNDGSTALLIAPGRRLKLDLSSILEGGDANKEQREKEARRRKKRRMKIFGAWGGFGGFGAHENEQKNARGFGGSDSPPAAGGGGLDTSGPFWQSSWKEYINEYTLTMDIKIQDPPREGLALFQTALVHAEDTRGQGSTRGRIKQSDGEALISPAGGVGVLGYFGDSKAHVKADRWHRVAVSVKCCADSKQKGEMLTYVDAVPGAVVKSEVISANGRFAIDPSAFFVFSSSQPAMMARTIAVRTIRVEAKSSDDKDAKAGLARDRVLSMFNMEREREVDAQRKGLSLAAIFGAKPRPMWSAPALVATFGDPFIEGTIFEGSSCLAWSFAVVNHIFQRMLEDQHSLFQAPAALPTRMALGDVANIFAKSAAVFKDMARLLKSPNNAQLMSFLRKLHNHLAMLPEGESILLPTIIEAREILLLLERNTERTYTLVVINTDPLLGLSHHVVSPAVKQNRLMYRTCLVLPGINKKNALDDVFWMAVYNLCLNDNEGDTRRFYDVLLPFLTGKPLEASLVESEQAANGLSDPDDTRGVFAAMPAAAAASSHSPAVFGPWRTPQRARTQYVRCLYHAVNFILTRRRGVSALRSKQVGLAMRLQMVHMVRNDLDYMHPDDNGHKVCQMAFRQLSYRAVKIADALESERSSEIDAAKTGKLIDSMCSICLEDMQEGGGDSVCLACSHCFHRGCLDELVNSGSRQCPLCRDDLAGAGSIEQMIDNVRNLLESCQSELLHTVEDQHPLPASLDLDARDPSWVGHAMAYDVEACDPDPGQVVSLQKFVPMDLLQIPEVVKTRLEAVSVLRQCDRLCTLLDNQHHNVKNTKHLILSLIQHVFIHVVPIPKPRKDPREEDASAKHVAARSQRRREKEEARKHELAAKREELRKAKGKRTPKKSADETAEANAADAEEKAYRQQEKLEMSPGAAAEKMLCGQQCIWDNDITYELQVEMLLVLQRLVEHFAAAVLSLQASRPLDAVRVVVPGCICAISDAIIRRRAVDNPSVACAQLMGLDAHGRQLGVQGFGISIGVFATQTETIEVYSPELVCARAAILDYFDSPLQRKLDKIFHWEEQYQLAPGRNLVKYLRMIAREIAMPNNNPHTWLCDDVPESSKILKNFPELRSYRDVCFYWKYFLNPDLKAFPNFSDARELSRMHTILSFHWSDEDMGYCVENSLQRLYCRPNPKDINPKTRRPFKEDELPKHRYPSTATPSFYAPPPAIKTEDDAIYRANLPAFDAVGPGRKGALESSQLAQLGQRDSELLISFLTVPYLRLPLVLNFFATDDRVHKLALPRLRDILDSVVFEPGRHLAMSHSDVEPAMVPTAHKELLGSVYGALLNELLLSPKIVTRSVISIMDSALALDTGSVCDSKSSDFNTSVEVILYVTRLAARVHNYLHFAVVQILHKHDRLRLARIFDDAPPDTLSTLRDALEGVGRRLQGPFADLLDDYLTRLDEETTAAPEDEQLVNRNSRLASDLNAHKLLCYRNCGAGGIDPLDQQSAKALVSSFIYLTTRHTWNKGRREAGRLLVPEFELYELFSLQRRRLVEHMMDLQQADLDAAMEHALQTATSTTGAACDKLVDASNQWGKLQGSRAAGRFVLVGSRANTADVTSEAKEKTLVRKTTKITTVPDVTDDSGLQGVEMDLQLGQMTLRSKHLAALDSEVANKPQVREVFGESTMQASLLERAEHRKRYKLIGVRHEIEYWHEGHACCPAVSDRWERDYDPAELHQSEMWIPPLFEPIRKAFFSGPQPPAMQFMMAPGPLPESAEMAVLLGLHPQLGGIFKLVYIFRSYRCVQVFECVSHARQYWFVLHLSTDCRYSLRHLQPETRSLINPLPSWWQRGGGDPYPNGVSSRLCSNLNSDPFGEAYASCNIIRDPNHELNLSGSRETLVPRCLLLGLIPEALLDSHRFWQDQLFKPGIANYRRLRGYPLETEDYLIVVDLFNESSGPNVVTGMTERAVRVERRNFETAKLNFKAIQEIASKIELLQLACAAPEGKILSKRAPKKQTLRFSVDDLVETLASDLLGDMAVATWVPCKVIHDNNDGTFDLQHTNEWSWLGVVKSVPAIHIQPRTKDVDVGKGIWRWEGLSDSEDDAFRSDASDDENRADLATAKPLEHKEYSLSLLQFWQLEAVLDASNWDVKECEKALEAIAAERRAEGAHVEAFHDMQVLGSAVQDRLKGRFNSPEKISEHGGALRSGNGSARMGPAAENRMLLVDLMFLPRSSRLFSMAQALCRIENLSHICAWTRDLEPKAKSDVTLDLVDLPRLKLSFAMRKDFEGKMRLFSLDHADLFVSNDFEAVTACLVAGIPHSVLLRNAAQGESQLLVPVLPPVRPKILTQPFTTDLVMDRSDDAWVLALSQRFFLYPIHVSSSFIVTKGLSSALYLLLLRLLHRDYDKAFHMADSISTDARFSEEQRKIYHALSFANDDPHPDAHSVRLKVTLVTMGCGEQMPWDLTRELAAYIQKSSHVSATCRISLEEELQLLSSSEVIIDETSPKFKPDVYSPYLLVLVKNRLHALRALLSSPGASGIRHPLAGMASSRERQEEVEAQCFVPPRALSDGWPWYQDNSVFGEEYNQAVEIHCAQEWQTFLDDGSLDKLAPVHLRQELAPPGGWLTVVMVHVLWSPCCIKLMPRYAELVPMHPSVTFLTLKGDLRGLDKLVKELRIEQFPTVLVMRGNKELEGTRLTGQERLLERLMRTLGEHVTESDRSAHVQLLMHVREAAGAESDHEEPEDDDEQLVWVFDVECSGPSMRVSEQGLCAEHFEDDEQVAEPPIWEYRNDNEMEDGWGEWLQMPEDLSPDLEKHYRRGVFYRPHQTNLYLNGWRYSKGVDLDWRPRQLKLHNNVLTGINGYWDDASYRRFQLRRRGERVLVKGEDAVITPEQIHVDKQREAMALQRKAMADYRRQEQRGRNSQAIRGTSAFHPRSGTHTWTLRWEHEPELAGCGDGIGVASAHSEAGGPCEPPLIGGKYDDSASVALYANGDLFHANQKMATAIRKTPREAASCEVTPFGKSHGENESSSGAHDQAGGDDIQTKDDQDFRRDESGEEEMVVDEDEDPSDEVESEGQDDYEGTSISSDGKNDDFREIVPDVDEKDFEENRKKANAANKFLEQGGGRKSVGGKGPLASLWGKGSLVTCIFDTEAGGGTLRFEIDGERLDACVENVFSMLGADEVYPCCCLFPLEPEVVTEKESGENAGEEEQEDASDEDDEEYTEESEEDEDKDEDEEDDGQSEDDSEEARQKSKKEKDVQNLAKAAKLDVSIIMAMSREKREELRKSVEDALRASRKARVTIIAPVLPVAVQEDSTTTGDQAGVAEKAGQDETADKEKEEQGGGEEAEDEDENEDVKIKKQAADESTQPLDKVRWMWEQASGLWEVYSSEISRELELARRSGSLEVTVRLGETTVLCKVSGGEQELVQERNDETQRLRRHVMKDGVFGMLEMMSVNYKPPLGGLYGEPCLQTLQKVWNSEENLAGRAAGLGFVFIYSLLQGQTRARVISQGFSDWWGANGGWGGGFGSMSATSSNDSHRLGLLLTQLLVDAKTKSVFASVLNVMGRNKQLSVRFPEFHDTRKNRSSHVFNAWTDEREPRSAIGDLFNKLVPLMQSMKKSKHGSFIFPPKMNVELPSPQSTTVYRKLSSADHKLFSANFSDLDCKERLIRTISHDVIRDLAIATKRKDWHGGSGGSDRLPVNVDDDLDLDDIVRSNKDAVLVLVFHANWSGTCRALAPLIRKLALRELRAARFLRIDIDCMDRLAIRLDVKTIPTIKVVRAGGQTPITKAQVLGTLQEINDDFVPSLMALVASAASSEEMSESRDASGVAAEEQIADLCTVVAANANELASLSSSPLEQLRSHIVFDDARTASDPPTLEVSCHPAAQSAVAKSMLKRMKDDVVAHHEQPMPKLKCLSAEVLQTVFTGSDDDSARRSAAQTCVEKVNELLGKLQQLRAQDTEAVRGISLLSNTVVNYIDLTAGGFEGRLERSKFVLRRAASQAAEVWPEFLFASILSSKGEQDLQRLNPYVPASHLETVIQLVMLGMLRANRKGHLSRCIGATVILLKLLREAVDKCPAQTSFPKFMQAGDDVASMIAAGRHFTSLTRGGDGLVDATAVLLDPRFLIFEFTWNILLRKKQVDIVLDFVEQVKQGKSKVKQMIMGAGKTTVVAPLLALILADSRSLVLSVVPKALLEMSRTQMRETFANIITKRISTFKFDRSTVPHEGMRLNLENAVRNRGVVVATPTSIKSIMLVYVETLRNLDECWRQNVAKGTKSAASRPFNRERVEVLSKQAKELQGILRLFRQGVMLLDEVDLILHPLKSELNFPLGEKVDLDCSEAGERWSLPIHIMDAIFFADTKRSSVFSDTRSGMALDILDRISKVLSSGYACRALQKLPHVTLLNNDWYHEYLKPAMAEWIYLWLQKQHLHGVSRKEAISYIVEGAVAGSCGQLQAKVSSLEAALAKTEAALGLRPPLSPPALTGAHLASLKQSVRQQYQQENVQVQEQVSQVLGAEPWRKKLLEVEQAELVSAATRTREQRDLVLELYKMDEEQETLVQASARRMSELQQQIVQLSQEIQEISSPEDDSYDNRTILWYSSCFSNSSSNSVGDGPIVESACVKLEEAGFQIRKCATQDEAAERASTDNRRFLRCIIAGGNSAQGCKRDCNRSHHADGNCMVCDQPWGVHNGHTCNDGRLGSWLSKSISTEQSSMDHFQFLDRLMQDTDVPPNRMLLFAGSRSCSLPESTRLDLWRKDVLVVEDKSQLLEWVEGLGEWGDGPRNDKEADPASPQVPHSPAALKRDESMGMKTLEALRCKLLEVEARKQAIAHEEEAKLECLRRKLVRKHSQLEQSIQQTVDHLAALKESVINAVGLSPADLDAALSLGPWTGREAALSIAWLKVCVLDEGSPDSSDQVRHADFVGKVKRSLMAVDGEAKWLSQAALAAKVMAHVTSPTQKKLLNLCYDWLRTFLPHILGKVNRVSFGLLSSKDCAAALEADAMVPQSRLKLAVPFVGKDVPSRSSEFAHPDVILGLTILGYRYSGMRFEDFIDLIDALSAEFSQEIGPARDRPSSQRHETWVLAAGGRIRGIKAKGKTVLKTSSSTSIQSADGAPAGGDQRSPVLETPGSAESLLSKGLSTSQQRKGSEEHAQGAEVVQLKFLQKSNAEQMQKLYHLWRKEPLAIHYYLSKFVFPAHMRSQKVKVSASGQALGGDMLVGRRVGFSGTPSDLLPKELGRCDYEQGDDGKMLKTVLDPQIVSYQVLQSDWNVEHVLAQIADSNGPRYHALIDTGALITGYSNLEVAAFLLKQGLAWCDGVVFLDENDEKQVLVRATGRAVPADQCGVPLEKRFAFYDQIHTTGMDIKHVVNATAVITLGKDMTFRDYVQGAYRMRGIGIGQKIHVYIIPEVADLILREIRAAAAHDCNSHGSDVLSRVVVSLQDRGMQAGEIKVEDGEHEKVLEALVTWLVINSMRTEQTQWSMLCVQNVSNIYRKNAFAKILDNAEALCNGELKDGDYVAPAVLSDEVAAEGEADKLPLLPSLKVFDEAIDFSLEAAVPDPIPFGEKLRDMLKDHSNFIISEEQHAVGHLLLSEVNEFACASENNDRDESSNLDTQQEREMEQEQEKEVKARRDQQIEVEKFVEREYSRHQERPSPWPVTWLGRQPACALAGAPASSHEADNLHPFYGLTDFHLLHQIPLPFPPALHLSRNYFNPAWSGLRRLKNVVCLLEWSPNTDPSHLRLIKDTEHLVQLTDSQRATIRKVHTLLSCGSTNGHLPREGLEEAVSAATNQAPLDSSLLDSLWEQFGGDGQGVTVEALEQILVSGHLYPAHKGRYWVAISLAEAETLRRLLHLRQRRALLGGADASRCELALHISQSGALGLPGSTMLDASAGWRACASGATHHEMAVALGCYRFFDCDMHYTRSTLAKIIRAFGGASCAAREHFFLSTLGARRRLDRKWQETPLAAVFSIADEWVNLKQNAQAAFVRWALKQRQMTPWEAFVAFDADNNSRLSPSELYGALKWLNVPELTPEDVVDFFELADANRDGMIEYSEYMRLFKEDGKPVSGAALLEDDAFEGEDDGDEDRQDGDSQRRGRSSEAPPKIEPFGADELRAIMVARRQRELERQRDELARRSVQQADLDIKLYREELQASARRRGGSNPRIYLSPGDDSILQRFASHARRLVVFSFTAASLPLRTSVTGKNRYLPVLIDDVRKNLQGPRCKNGHTCASLRGRWGRCALCDRGYMESKRFCRICYYFVCGRCDKAYEDEQVKERSDPAGKHTFIQCEIASEINITMPPRAVDLDSAVSPTFHDEETAQQQAAAQRAAPGGTSSPLSSDFSVTIEMKLLSLPPSGQLAALVRFNSPDSVSGMARRRHMASLYLDSRGHVGHNLQALPLTDGAATTGGRQECNPVQKDDDQMARSQVNLREGRWIVLTASVEVAAGRMTTYIDGKLFSAEQDLEPRDLSLGSKLVVLGGGKAAQSRGGSVRRVLVHDVGLTAEQALSTYVACAQDNPAINGKLASIQAAWRGRQIRKKNPDVLHWMTAAKENRAAKKKGTGGPF